MANKAPSDATTENDTETALSRQLSDEAARRRRLLAARMSTDAAANGTNLQQLGAVGPHTRQNCVASFLKFEIWINQREAKAVTNKEIDARFMKGNPASSGNRLLSAWMDKVPRSAGTVPASCHLPGEASRAGSAFYLVAGGSPGCQRYGRGLRLVEQGQLGEGLLVMAGLLPYARLGEFLCVSQCDLVPPLGGALQNFSIILAAEETGRPTKVRTFNDTLELDERFGAQFRPLLGSRKRPRLGKPVFGYSGNSSRKRQQI